MKNSRTIRLFPVILGMVLSIALLSLLYSLSQQPLQAAQPETGAFLWHSASYAPQHPPGSPPRSPIQTEATNALINDGSFEDSPSAWLESINQTACGSPSKIGNWSSIFTNTAATYDGFQALWVGGVCNSSVSEPLINSAEQFLTVPANATKLSFWYSAYRWDPDSPPLDDVAYVEINQQRVWQLDLMHAANTSSWQRVELDISSFAGQQILVKFGNETGFADTSVGNVLFDFIEFNSAPVSTPIDPVSGGTLTFTDLQGSDTTVEVPGRAVSETTQLVFVPQSNPGFPLPPDFVFANHAFDLDAFATRIFLPTILNNASPATPAGYLDGIQHAGSAAPDSFTFLKPITLTIEYTDGDIGGIGDEGTLAIYYYDEQAGQWIDVQFTCPNPSGYTSDPANNFVQVQACHLSRMGLIGR